MQRNLPETTGKKQQTYMKQTEKPIYVTPAIRVVGFALADVICGSNTLPGGSLPYDPEAEDTL